MSLSENPHDFFVTFRLSPTFADGDVEVVANPHALENARDLKLPGDAASSNLVCGHADDFPVKKSYGTRIGSVDAAEDVEERALPRTVRTDDAAKIAFMNMEAQSIQRSDAAETPSQIPYDKGRSRHLYNVPPHAAAPNSTRKRRSHVTAVPA